jgi:hypothetical protein
VDPEIPTPESECAVEFSDDALALMFTAAYAEDLRYIALLGKWLLWSGNRWKFEETLRAFDLARLICRRAKRGVRHIR